MFQWEKVQEQEAELKVLVRNPPSIYIYTQLDY